MKALQGWKMLYNVNSVFENSQKPLTIFEISQFTIVLKPSDFMLTVVVELNNVETAVNCNCCVRAF